MAFRIAIGSCRCADGINSRNALVRELCSRINRRLERLRSFAPEMLAKLPPLSSEEERIEDRVVRFTTYRDNLQSGDQLIVVQGFLPSWRFPTYIGPAGIGHMYTEGLLLGADRRLTNPDEKLLWPFR
jgi:hypothetical protein